MCIRDSRRLAKERAQIVHQVDTPVTETPGAYIRGYLVATVKHDNTLGIDVYKRQRDGCTFDRRRTPDG